MVSTTEGSPTNTCWKRRSRAASFSMFSRYSSKVVAPTRRSSPRASMGLSMFPASMEPSPVPPAPTTVWSSSMKVTIWPSEALISSSTDLRRSSNSPRYLAPATIAPRSRLMRRLSRSDSGTSASTMRCASPSTTAVLPTPGSPMRTGLFFVRRESTCTTRRISESRPMTGSSAPSRASAVRSVPYCSSASEPFCGFSLVTFVPPRRASSSADTAAASAVIAPVSTSARVRTSTARWVSPRAVMMVCACCSSRSACWPSWGVWPVAVGRLDSVERVAAATASGEVPPAVRREFTVASPKATVAAAMWAGVISAWPAAWASRWAMARTSDTRVVG